MANGHTVLFDQSKSNGRAQILFRLDTAAAYTFVVKAQLSDDDITNYQEVQIERIRWNTSGLQTLQLAFAPAHIITTLTGSGHWYHDFQIKPTLFDALYGDAVTENGDLVITPSTTDISTLILDIRKIKGFTGRSDQSN